MTARRARRARYRVRAGSSHSRRVVPRVARVCDARHSHVANRPGVSSLRAPEGWRQLRGAPEGWRQLRGQTCVWTCGQTWELERADARLCASDASIEKRCDTRRPPASLSCAKRWRFRSSVSCVATSTLPTRVQCLRVAAHHRRVFRGAGPRHVQARRAVRLHSRASRCPCIRSRR